MFKSEKSKLLSKKAGAVGLKIAIPIARWIFLLAISYILLYPLLYMISFTFRAPLDFYDATVIWVPKNFSLSNIERAWQLLHYDESFLNTLIIEIASALIEVVTCAITAYGLARFEFKEKKFLMFFLIITILVPTEILIIPQMTSMKAVDIFGIFGLIADWTGIDIRLNLLNTPLAFYVPSLLAVGLKSGLFIYMYVQFFKGLPKELEEAASIDGAGPLKTFITIVVPSSGVIFLTVTIFSVIWHWNDTTIANMFLSKDFPLACQLNNFSGSANNLDLYNPANLGILLACCLLFILPPLILYCILQKQFIKSIDRVGIVG